MKFSRLSQVIIATATAAISLQTFAEGSINYDQIGIQYLHQNLDDADCSQSGVFIDGTKSINNDFFALASLTDASGNHGCGSNTLALGAGIHSVFGADSSMYGTLSYENTSVDHGTGDSGLVLAAGLRGFVQQDIEARVELAHHTAFDGNTVLTAGANYWINPGFAATGEVSLGSDTNGISIGILFNY